MQIPKRENMFKCPNECGKRYKHQISLNQHLKNECGVAPRFKCTYCSYAGKRNTHLKSHLLRMHKQPQ
ncbi:hypothetical protein HUJ05_009057 [Dendroctonus ponderosae]|nr:hypothetical protein HUJ05_009057 [Dendroctonus ponderosae]